MQTAVVLAIAMLLVGTHLVTAGRYGIFRDELYYIACSRHLAWGYVDHPPLIAGLTWLVTHLFGSNLIGLRLLPALAAGALVLLTAALARELGGGASACVLSALAVVAAPIFLIMHHWLTMNAFEPLLWTGVFWCAARLTNSDDPRLWLPIGALIGVGLETKYSIVCCAVALLFGMAATPQRRWLADRWAVTGGICAVLIFLPNLVWLIVNHFPFLEFERHSRESGSRIVRGPVAFVLDQALIMSPAAAPLCAVGFAWLLAGREARRYRALGVAAVSIFVGLLLLQAKNYYLAPLYPLMMAAGAVGLERLTLDLAPVRVAYAAAVIATTVVIAPLVMPILSPRDFLSYRAALGGFTPVQFERPKPGLPQYFADEFGWREMARQTAVAYAAVPRAERADTAIFANDYGEAAAIDVFGPALGLPPAISKAESYWLWGPRGYTGRSVIVLGSDGTGDREHFRTVRAAGVVNAAFARSDERFTIWTCSDLVEPLSSLWPKIKAW